MVYSLPGVAALRYLARDAATAGTPLDLSRFQRDDGGYVRIEGVPMTIHQYRSLPEGSGYAYLDGLCFRDSPTVAHQDVAFRVAVLLYACADRARLGRACQQINIWLDERNAPVPDACFILGDRLAHLSNDGLHGVAPDLCVEVLSATTERRDRGRKTELYARYGCGEYWLVDCERQRLEVLRRDGAGRLVLGGAYARGEAFDSTAVTGLPVEVGGLFPQP